MKYYKTPSISATRLNKYDIFILIPFGYPFHKVQPLTVPSLYNTLYAVKYICLQLRKFFILVILHYQCNGEAHLDTPRKINPSYDLISNLVYYRISYIKSKMSLPSSASPSTGDSFVFASRHFEIKKSTAPTLSL